LENKSELQKAVELLEGAGFHVTDANEERAQIVSEHDKRIRTDEEGLDKTGAIRLRIVPVKDG
jgi:hypothetical protein